MLKRPKYLRFLSRSQINIAQSTLDFCFCLVCTEINACLTKKMFMLSNSLSGKINWYFCWSTFLCLGISQDYIVVSQWGGTTYQPPRKQQLCTAEPALPKRPPLSRGHISLSGPDENGPPVWGSERQLPMTVSSQTQNLLITAFDAGTTSLGNLFVNCW